MPVVLKPQNGDKATHRTEPLVWKVLASQLHFLAQRNVELAAALLFWPLNCVKIGSLLADAILVGGHVALLSGSSVCFLFCASALIKREWKSSQVLTRIDLYVV